MARANDSTVAVMDTNAAPHAAPTATGKAKTGKTTAPKTHAGRHAGPCGASFDGTALPTARPRSRA